MADTTHSHSAPSGPPSKRWNPGAWGVIALILALVAIFAPDTLAETITFTLKALGGTAPFIAFAVLAVAYLKASGAETLLAKAFEGNPARMIVMAALLGGLSPFCSCEVIPFIAALLAVGAPLGAVMAFWLASPLMDPAMFAITSGTLGFDFALAKTVAAVSLGMFGGFGVMLMANTPIFANPLRETPAANGCCSTSKPFSGTPVWQFWNEPDRRATFTDTARSNALFLIKWLTLAYLIEALMLRYVPADLIANFLGGTGVVPILLGALVGAPAYLNGYAAVPLIDALLAQGMSNGAAMSFVIAGGVSCIPAAIAVWALVKPRVFAAYLGFALTGAIAAGLVWQAIA
ncbi:permease [Sulfitobacter sp. M57]|uniref:permease n=1 Tax=unclassified Sulfitobacter TaxID=196795 RepID=UPI0023E0AE09|nr:MULTISPECIES: permease [unclassified Sulfitobacter]MDF3415750.1 permease [Sulfitobacter sp. KE5]MDF3423230.1 permease [Sulfitobacter sp. KE43]MDF3434296.1 permease [Sulfitobacter sp. KE42]MDF3459671.1 permease [Sulfitobacter sp. S74]MDF3463834.1 permease [Sulfitobacter sp. Ks18]